MLFVALITAVIGSTYLEQSPSVGSDCTQGKPVFKINTFTVNPWPITNQLSVNITMAGYLSSATFLYEIWVSSTSPNYLENQQVPLAQQYPQGNITIPFIYVVQYPAGPWNVVLTVRDSLFNVLSCWNFQYNNGQ